MYVYQRFVEFTDGVLDSSRITCPLSQRIAEQDAGGEDPLDQVLEITVTVIRDRGDARRACFI
jgi:hypothetical protein